MTQSLSCVVTATNKTVLLGVLPIGSNIVRVFIQVLIAFNSSGTDLIRIGYTGTTNAFATDTDVSTTGIKSPTLGASAGYQTGAHQVYAYYTAGVADQTLGKAVVNIEYFLNSQNP